MKKIITIIALSTAALMANAQGDELMVSNVSYVNGKTVVSLSRSHSAYNVYTDTIQSYTFGEFKKTFNGTLTSNQVVDKVTRYVDDFITVSNGSYKKEGQVYKLAESRKSAFFSNGYEGYFAELTKQLADEK